MIKTKEEIIKQINETTLRIEKVEYNEDLTAEQEDFMLEDGLERAREEREEQQESFLLDKIMDKWKERQDEEMERAEVRADLLIKYGEVEIED